MAWTFNSDTDRCDRTATVPALTTAWTASFRFNCSDFGANGTMRPAFGIIGSGGGGEPYFFFVPQRTSGGNNGWKVDYNFGGGFLSGDSAFDDVFVANTEYHIYLRYDGTNIRLYIDGTLVWTSASGTFSGTTSKLQWGYNDFDAVAMRGTISCAKFWTVDLGNSGSVITAEGQYRNPQNSAGSCWEAWHAKTGDLGNGDLNGRDMTLTGVTFTADSAAILGDDPAPGYIPPDLPFVYRRVVPA